MSEQARRPSYETVRGGTAARGGGGAEVGGVEGGRGFLPPSGAGRPGRAINSVLSMDEIEAAIIASEAEAEAGPSGQFKIHSNNTL